MTEDALSSFGSSLSLALYASSLATVVSKGRSKTKVGTNGLSGCSAVPYVALLTSCLLWTQYSILINDPTLVYINTVGVLFSFVSTVMFYKYSDSKERVETTMLQGLACVFPILLYVRYKGPLEAKPELGTACAVFSLLMIVSPLVALRTIIRTKSAAQLSFPFAICSLCSCIVWTLYGIIRSDSYIVFPNAVGAITSFLQVALLVIYGSGNHIVVAITAPNVAYARLPSEKEKDTWIV